MKQRSGLFKNPKLMSDRELILSKEFLIRRRTKIEEQIRKVSQEQALREYVREKII